MTLLKMFFSPIEAFRQLKDNPRLPLAFTVVLLLSLATSAMVVEWIGLDNITRQQF